MYLFSAQGRENKLNLCCNVEICIEVTAEYFFLSSWRGLRVVTVTYDW
jgi:hypothetical protein